MSTICKLDPTIRQRRQARRDLLAFLESKHRHITANTRIPLNARQAALNWLVYAIDLLENVIRDPKRTGRAKSRIASRLAHEFQDLQSKAEKPL